MEIASRAKAITPSLTLEITARAKKMKADGVEVVSFAAGEPDFPTPDYITDAAREALDKGFTKYTPAAGIPALRAAICAKLKDDNGLDYEPDNIVVSNGAKHSLFNAFMAILDLGDRVVIPSPYWLSYPEIVKMAGGVPTFVRTEAKNGFKMTAEELDNAITDRTKAVVINSPNNPTGAVYSRDELNALAAVAERRGIYVVSDEIYEKLVYGCEHYSIAACSDILKERTVVVNGMSKTYSMTGWRVGYAAANREIASAMASMQSHSTSNANSIAQYASAVALGDKLRGEAFLKWMTAEFGARRALITSRLRDAGVEFIEPDGAFYVMASVRKFLGKRYGGKLIRTAFDFASALLEHALVAVVPCEGFGAPDYVRLSYAASEADIERGIRSLAAFVSKPTDR